METLESPEKVPGKKKKKRNKKKKNNKLEEINEVGTPAQREEAMQRVRRE
jgi:hypothetical protein